MLLTALALRTGINTEVQLPPI